MKTFTSFAATLLCTVPLISFAQTPRILNVFDSDKEGWTADFGADAVATDGTLSANGGALTFQTFSGDVGVQDNFDNVNSFSNPGAVGHDVTGLTGLEFDLGMTGPEPVTVNFYTRSPLPSDPNSIDYVSLGDVTIPNDGVVRTYTQMFSGESPVFDTATDASLATLRVYGIYAYPHTTGTYDWTLEEVRTFGTPQTNRVLADFTPTADVSGLQGAFIDFQADAIVGSDFSNDRQAGLTATGSSLQFQSQFVDGSTGGGAIGMGNGFFPYSSGDGFFNRSLDLSSYNQLEVDVSVSGSAGDPIDVGAYVRSTQSFTFQSLGNSQTVARDSGSQTLIFDLRDAVDLNFLVGYGLTFSEPASGESPVTITIDEVRASFLEPSSVADWSIYR